MKPMRRTLHLMVLSIVFVESIAIVGCGGSQGSGVGTPPPSTPNLIGDWQAIFSSSVVNVSGKVYGYFSQSGNSTTANLHFDGSPCFTTGPSTGTVTGNSVTFALVANGQTATFTGTLDTSGNSIQGTYTVSGGCGDADRGSWSATKIQTGQCVSAPLRLLSWWRGEGNASDERGFNPATIQGGVSFVPGMVGQAFSYDGSTGYLNVPDSPSLESISTAESVEMWVSPRMPVGATVQYLYARRNPFLSESFSVYILTNGALGFIVKTTSSPTNTGSQFESAPGVITFGQFQHVAATANATTGVASVYLDGRIIPLTAVFGPQTFSGTFASVPYLWIGRREDIAAGEGVGGAAYFNGVLDEVTLYATELDQAQVQFIFHAGNGGKCLTP